MLWLLLQLNPISAGINIILRSIESEQASREAVHLRAIGWNPDEGTAGTNYIRGDDMPDGTRTYFRVIRPDIRERLPKK